MNTIFYQAGTILKNDFASVALLSVKISSGWLVREAPWFNRQRQISQMIKKYYHGIYTIMLSGQETYNSATQTIRKGAEHFIVKDEDAFEKIAQMINKG